MIILNHFVLSAYLTSATTLLLGLFVLVIKRPWQRLYIVFAAYSFSIAFWSFCVARFTPSFSDPGLTWGRMLHIGAALVPVLFLHFVHELLRLENPKFSKSVLAVAYVATGAFIILALSGLMLITGVTNRSEYSYPTPGPLYPFFFAYVLLSIVLGIWRLLRAFIQSSGARRNQLKYLVLFSSIGYLGIMKHFLILVGLEPFPLYPYGTYAAPIYVLAVMYAITRYRLLDITVTLTRFATFILFYLPLLLLPIIGGNVMQPLLMSWIGAKWWIIPTAFEALFAAVGLIAYRYVGQLAESRVLADQRRYQSTLRRASEGMTRIHKIQHLLKLTVRILAGTVGLTHASIYLADPKTKRYVQQTRRGKDGRPIGDVLEPDDPLIKYLLVHKNAVVAEELHLQRQQTPESGLREVEMSLRRLGAALIIPSFVHDHLLGFVVMGAKRSGRMYTDDDLKVLSTLANQAALAIENAQFHEAEKERQAELFHTAQLASLGTMAGSMSHQINNRFYAECIMTGTLKNVWKEMDLTGVPEPVKQLILKTIETLQKVEDDTIRGGDIAKTLLNFSKPGKVARITFSDVLKSSTEIAQFRVKFDEIDFEPVISDPLPPLDGNLNQLAEVFFNLMANAYDAIKKKEEAVKDGHLKLLAGQTYKGRIAISVSAMTKNGVPWLKAVVHDTGIGVEAENMPSLFIPFFTTKATAEKGTGLGLYVLKKVVENHGGEIEVNSTYGEGTTFAIYLPAATGAA